MKTVGVKKALLSFVSIVLFGTLVAYTPVFANDYIENFTAGWHLISMPCQPSITTPSLLFAAPIDSVYEFTSSGFKDILSMAPVTYGKVYWIHLASDSQITISGSAVATAGITIPISVGWNPVGSPFTDSMWASATINSNPVNPAITRLLSYTPPSGLSYASAATVIDYSTSTVDLAQWKGYFVKSTTSGTLLLKNNGYTADPTMPSNVQLSTCQKADHSELCLTWTAPTDTNYHQYNVYAYDPEEEETKKVNSGLIPVTHSGVQNLSAGKTYGIEVSSVKVSGGTQQESNHTNRAVKSTVALAGNQAMVTLGAMQPACGPGGLCKVVGDAPDGYVHVPDAQVELRDSSGNLISNSTTDEYGWVEFIVSATDTYSIDAVKDMGSPGPSAEDIGIHTNATLGAGTVKQFGQVELKQPGFITGRVILADVPPPSPNYIAARVVVPGTSYQSSVSEYGTYTIQWLPPTYASGTYKIAAVLPGYETVQQGGLIVETASYTVAATMTLGLSYSQLEIAPTNKTIAPGESLQFHATGTLQMFNPPYRDLTNSVTWFSSNPSVGAISATGTFTASAMNTGQTTITAKYATDGPEMSTSLYVHNRPHLSGITPTKGNNDNYTNITATGSNFVSGAGLYIGTYPAVNVSVFSSTELVAQVPFNIPVGDYPVSIVNPDGLGHAFGTFTVEYPPPALVSVNPNTEINTATNTNLTISGTPFVAGPSLAVSLGSSYPCLHATRVSTDTLVASFPTGISYGTYDLLVTNGDGKHATMTSAFRVTIPGVEITGASPTRGVNSATTSITITGDYFASGAQVFLQKGASSRELDSVNVLSASTMTAVVPVGLPWNTYDLKVINADYKSGTGNDMFAVTLPAPIITNYSPSFMINSEQQLITVTGKNFVSGSSVLIGGTNASIVNVATSTALTFLSPSGIAAGSYTITITNPDSGQLFAATPGFTVKGLVLINVTPSTLPINKGATSTFTAICRLTDGQTSTDEYCTDDVTWVSTNPSLGSVSATGLFTATASGTGNLNVFAQKGTTISNNAGVYIYDPSALYLDTYQRPDYSCNLCGDGMCFAYTASTVAVADIDNDTYKDLIVGHMTGTMPYSTMGIYIYVNDQTGHFRGPTQIITGAAYKNTTSIFVGDFDNDGYMDIAQGNNGVASNILLNNGNGTFTATQTIGTVNSNSIIAADVDSDGDLDVINGSGTSNIWLNSGKGKFTISAQSLGYSSALVAADVNNDGYIDIIQGIYNQPTVIWINNGKGTFASSTQTLGTYTTESLAATDINGDGNIDIIQGNYNQPTNIWMNNGSGVFTQHTTAGHAKSVYAADLDNDGDTDVIMAYDTDVYATTLWLNDGHGNLAQSSLILPSAVSAFAADIQNDGKMDVILETSMGALIYSGGNGTKSNTEPTTPSTFDTVGVALDANRIIDDVNLIWDDGSDFESGPHSLTYSVRVGTSPDSHNILANETMMGIGNTMATHSIIIRNLPFGQYFANIKTIDAGFMGSDWSYTKTFYSGPMFTDTGKMLNINSGFFRIFAADLDKDGDLDILTSFIWPNFSPPMPGPFKLYKNNGGGNFSDTGQSLGTDQQGAIIATDVDNDGDLDIVTGAIPGNTKVYLNDGFGNFANSGQSFVGGTTSLFAADLNNDGSMDITNGNKVLINNGLGTFTDSGQALGATRSVFVADVDRDGDMDIITGSETGVKIFLNNKNGVGLGKFTDSGQNPLPNYRVRSLFAADVDNDGDMDIVATTMLCFAFGENCMYWPPSPIGQRILKNNNGTFTDSGQKLSASNGDDIESVFPIDFDTDGVVELVSGNALFDNSGSGVFNLTDDKDVNSRENSLFVGRFKSGGMPDVINGEAGKIYEIGNVLVNTPPSMPSGLTTVAVGATATISWDPSNDGESPNAAITYNLGFSTMTGVIATSVNPPMPGNIGRPPKTAGKHVWTLSGLPAGTYHWSVQAVDNGYMQSQWAIEQTFTLP